MSDIRQYLARIGAKGGRKSRRTLEPATARAMVRVREARQAFRRFRTMCFWSYRPDLEIGIEDVPWVAELLMKHGNQFVAFASVLADDDIRMDGNRPSFDFHGGSLVVAYAGSTHHKKYSECGS
jgi:hypothetical protein